MVKIPLWHWGGNYYKYKAARSESIVKSLELEEAKEKIELQVSQASYKTAEAAKTLRTTESNLSKADENLRQAQLGYKGRGHDTRQRNGCTNGLVESKFGKHRRRNRCATLQRISLKSDWNFKILI